MYGLYSLEDAKYMAKDPEDVLNSAAIASIFCLVLIFVFYKTSCFEKSRKGKQCQRGCWLVGLWERGEQSNGSIACLCGTPSNVSRYWSAQKWATYTGCKSYSAYHYSRDGYSIFAVKSDVQEAFRSCTLRRKGTFLRSTKGGQRKWKIYCSLFQKRTVYVRRPEHLKRVW